MWTPWTNQRDNFARTYDLLSSFRRQMDQALGEMNVYGRGERAHAHETWPQLSLEDLGSELMLTADVPGMSEGDLQLHATAEAMTIAGERTIEPPSGYSVHRRERPAYKFSQSVRFPVRVDVEKVKATVKNGVLTVKLAKAADAQPRQITIGKA